MEEPTAEPEPLTATAPPPERDLLSEIDPDEDDSAGKLLSA